MKISAPNDFANDPFFELISAAIILLAPAAFAPRIADSPTPPSPITRRVSPNLNSAEFITAPTPVITAQPNKAAISKGKSFSIFIKDSSVATENSEKPDTPK